MTKYNPAYRDERGAYTREEWTFFAQIGEEFGGVVFQMEEYVLVEDAYVEVALALLEEAGVSALTVAGLEDSGGSAPEGLTEGALVTVSDVGRVLRRLLREEFWCRLEGESAFIHVGWDFYMYVGLPVPCVTSRELAARRGIFVEDFRSPYVI